MQLFGDAIGEPNEKKTCALKNGICGEEIIRRDFAIVSEGLDYQGRTR